MIKIGICDDDVRDVQYAAVLVQGILRKYNIKYKVHLFQSPNDMLAYGGSMDIGILAVVMEELCGIQLGKQLKQKHPHIQIIYITGYEEYCMAAINEVHAYSYICKPIEEIKLEQQLAGLIGYQEENQAEKDFYCVTDRQGKEYAAVKINLSNVLYFEYIKRTRKVRIVLYDDTYDYSCTLEQLADEMQNYGFVVNCRGYLVNLLHVAKVKGRVIYLDNGKELPVSQKRVAEFKEQLNQYRDQRK